jgi:hypothetical protein
VLLTIGSLVSASLIQREQEKTREANKLLQMEQANTNAAYELEKKRAQEAEQRFLLARQSVDEMVKIADEELADSPPLQELRQRLLETSVVYYQELIKQQRDDHTRQEELASARQRVLQMLSDLAELQGAGQLRFLKQPSVLDDLQADDGQRHRIEALSRNMSKELRDSFHEFHRLTSEQRRRGFLELARKNEETVKQILTPKQLVRFKQIALQLQGPQAFRETSVADALKLTPEQKTQIRAIEAETFFVMADGICSHGPPEGGKNPPRDHNRRVADRPPEKHPPPHDQGLKSATDRILAILTPEQVKRWREMTGASFKGSFRHGPFGPPPGGPGGPPDHFGPPPERFGQVSGSSAPPP